MDSPQNPQSATLDGTAPAAGTPPVGNRAGTKISSNRDIAVVQADYLALANDLEQAQALASTLELELSGKTNELARFKLIWERTQSDLVKFEHDLDVMRKERHSLANEVQKAYAIEHKYERLKFAYEDATAKVERLEADLLQERAAHQKTRQELEAASKSPGRPPAGANDSLLRENLEALRDEIDRVLSLKPGKPGTSSSHPPVRQAPEHIDIEFTT